MRRILIPFVMIAVLAASFPAQAQEAAPYIIHSTKPISPTLEEQLNTWLAASPPSSAPYYIVTYSKVKNTGATQVSLAGVDLPSPQLPVDWSMFEEGNGVVWMGSVTVLEDGTVIPFFNETQGRGPAAKLFKVVFLPALPAGGGSYVGFPFQAGSAMIYGPRAVHGSGDYGTSGMLAVDLVSGDDLGAGAAPPYAYASDAGTIDYVCDDGVTVAVRTHNSSTDDYFVYAHLLDNANLAIDEEFSRGESLGSIKYGNFDDDCGWAAQQEDHYHIHWMFEPDNGSFQAEGCVLNVANKRWVCGSEEIGTGGWLRGGGGFGVGLDDLTGGSGATAERSFWDYILVGFLTIFDNGILRTLPNHNPFEFVYAIVATIKLLLKILWILHYSGNFNIFPLIALFLWAVFVNSIMGLAWFAAFLLKAWKSLVPILGA